MVDWNSDPNYHYYLAFGRLARLKMRGREAAARSFLITDWQLSCHGSQIKHVQNYTHGRR